MSYTYSYPSFFKDTKTGNIYTCYSQGTSYGFRHVAFKGLELNPKLHKPAAKRSYYNRTWERWTYESVLSDLVPDTDNLEPASITVK